MDEGKKLTPRELEIALLVCEGFTNKEIAQKLDVSVSNVKFFITKIFKKYEISNRARFIYLFLKEGKVENELPPAA